MAKKSLLVMILVFVLVVSVNISVLAVGKLINIPTADLAGGKGAVYGEMRLDSFRQIGGVYTVTPELEAGGIISFNDDNTELGLQAKTIFGRESTNEPAIAAGIRENDLYFVVSKNIGMGFRGHLGVGNGTLDGLFIGFNKVVNPVNVSRDDQASIPAIDLMVEYVDRKMNIGARMNLQQDLRFDLSLVNLKHLRLGMGYIF